MKVVGNLSKCDINVSRSIYCIYWLTAIFCY